MGRVRAIGPAPRSGTRQGRLQRDNQEQQPPTTRTAIKMPSRCAFGLLPPEGGVFILGRPGDKKEKDPFLRPGPSVR
ncbi:hypothetical protein BOTU111921_14975 [Bordetella tumbae]